MTFLNLTGSHPAGAYFSILHFDYPPLLKSHHSLGFLTHPATLLCQLPAGHTSQPPFLRPLWVWTFLPRAPSLSTFLFLGDAVAAHLFPDVSYSHKNAVSSLILAQHAHIDSLLLPLAHPCSLLFTLAHSLTFSPSPRSRAAESAPGGVSHLLVLHWPQAQLSESKHLTFSSKPAHLPGLAALLVRGPAILSTPGKRLSHSCLLLLRHPT